MNLYLFLHLSISVNEYKVPDKVSDNYLTDNTIQKLLILTIIYGGICQIANQYFIRNL